MTRTRLLLMVATATVLLVVAAPAVAKTWVHVGAGVDSFHVGVHSTEHQGSPPTTANAEHPAGTWHVADLCSLGGKAICHASTQCPDGSAAQWMYFVAVTGVVSGGHEVCSTGSLPVQPTLTPARILEAFRRLPLPESPLLIQPAGGRTIVNFDTIFYTTRGPFSRTVALLGHQVTFAIEPASFTWVWGDGERRVTSTPGRPFRPGVPVASDITHRYLTKDRFEPHLDTTYAATYSVDGGGSRPVGGTVTIVGTPRELATVTYTPLLVND